MKKLLYFMSFLAFILITGCPTSPKDNKWEGGEKGVGKDTSQSKKSEPIQKFVSNQLVINFTQLPADRALFEKKMKDLGYIKVATCPCSPKLQLWQDTTSRVRLNPDTEVKEVAKGNGGNGMGVSHNYIFDDLIVGKTFNTFVDPNTTPAQPTDSSVLVSIIDSGVDQDNTSLRPRLSKNRGGTFFCNTKRIEGDYGVNIINAIDTPPPPTVYDNLNPIDHNGHGTLINGIIAGKSDVDSADRQALSLFLNNNPQGVRIQQLNVAFTPNTKTDGTLFHALCGIHYSLNKNAKIINASWRILTTKENKKEAEVFIPTLAELTSGNNDALLVVSSGNDTINFETNNDGKLAWPAAFSRPQTDIIGLNKPFYNNVITVGAWDMMKNNIAYFSNTGANVVDIYAPGMRNLSILSRYAPNIGDFRNWAKGQGTSFAAPFVVRTAAILRGLHPEATAASIKAAIIGSAQSFTTTNTNQTIKLLRHQNAINALH